MKALQNILNGVYIELVEGSTDRQVAAIQFDSREIEASDVFVAIRGAAIDGHRYIDSAAKNGAVVFIVEELPQNKDLSKTYIQVKDSKKALAITAANYYNNPSRDLKLIGVTGTNGKTTIASLLYQLFHMAGYGTGLISTIHILIGKKEFGTSLTTPDSLTINKYLAQMRDEGVEFAFMEVSSHGIAQERTAGLDFNGGIFTNLSHEHLDYHKTFAEYRNVKKRFFDGLPQNAFALTNKDDKNGPFMLQNTSAQTYTYALKNSADYKAKIIENELTGLQLRINGKEVWSRLIGKFNAYNLLAIYAAADLLNVPEAENLQYLSKLRPVAGRFQHFISPRENITVVVDYAHTPDALKNILETLKTIKKDGQRVITVVGCGGDRDANKRPEMAKIAVNFSNRVILTSDNPRTEDPEAIIRDMEKGIDPEGLKRTMANSSRRQAIKTACTLAAKNDMVLIAGKGHETYQLINGEVHDFDDLKIARELMQELNK